MQCILCILIKDWKIYIFEEEKNGPHTAFGVFSKKKWILCEKLNVVTLNCHEQCLKQVSTPQEQYGLQYYVVIQWRKRIWSRYEEN